MNTARTWKKRSQYGEGLGVGVLQQLPHKLTHIPLCDFVHGSRRDPLSRFEALIEAWNIGVLIQDSGRDPLRRIRRDLSRLPEIAHIVSFGRDVVTFFKQVLVRGKMIVGGARLQDVDKGEPVLLVFDGGFKHFRKLLDVAGESSGDESWLERENKIHARNRALGDSKGRCIHRLPLPRERTRLSRREPVVLVIVEDECHRIITADRMHKVPHALGEAGAIAPKRNNRHIHIGKLGARCKRQDAAMEPVEAVAHELIRRIPMAADIEAEKHLPRVEFERHKRTLDRRPDAIIAATVAPRTLVFVMVIGHGGTVRVVR